MTKDVPNISPLWVPLDMGTRARVSGDQTDDRGSGRIMLLGITIVAYGRGLTALPIYLPLMQEEGL